MKRWIICFLILVSGCLCAGCAVSMKETVYEASGVKLNTYVRVTLYEGGNDEIAQEAVALCDYYEEIFSRTSETSLLYQANEAGGFAIDSKESEILAELIQTGVQYGLLTDGAMDITVEPLTSLWNFGNENEGVPKQQEIEEGLALVDFTRLEIREDHVDFHGCRLDLGAVAKGYIADRIRDYLTDAGVTSALIDLGGNILCLGHKNDGSSFSIGIQNPSEKAQGVIAALSVSDKSVVTSGIYERYFYEDDVFYHHILSPKSGYPSETGLRSVTIIAEDAVVCDALSTGCFVLGLDDGMALVNRLSGVEAVMIDEDYKLYFSEGAEALILK